LQDINGISTRGSPGGKALLRPDPQTPPRSFASVINVSGKSASVKRQCRNSAYKETTNGQWRS